MHDGGLAGRIITEVAETRDVDERDLPSLYNFVEMDALESLATHQDTHTRSDLSVEFRYAGCWVNVGGVDAIEVTELAQAAAQQD